MKTANIKSVFFYETGGFDRLKFEIKSVNTSRWKKVSQIEREKTIEWLNECKATLDRYIKEVNELPEKYAR